MKKRKMTRDSDVIALDNDIKVAALLTTAAIVTNRDDASFFLTSLAESIIRALPKPLQTGAEKLIKKDAVKLLETIDGSAKPNKRRAKA